MQQNWPIFEFKIYLIIISNYLALNNLQRVSHKINSINDTYLETRMLMGIPRNRLQ